MVNLGFIGVFFFILCAQSNVQQQVKEIDQKIEELTAKKDLYQADAAQREDEANRWQFDADEEEDARRAFEQVDEDRRKIHALEIEIQQLRQRKELLLSEQ